MNHPHPGLSEPPLLEKGVMRILALGGLGEIGRNMTVFEINNEILIVDCGVLFPEESQPGIDLILPDFSYLDEKLDQIKGIVLTHGHEDHIGALPYFLKRKGGIPLIGSEFTLALIEGKLKEHKVTTALQVVKEGETLKLGEFNLEFVAVNHSIPDALAISISTQAGRALITGDFKMDQLPLDNRITDLDTFARMGREGIDLFMVDSTNADVPGFNVAERDIKPALEKVMANTKRRVIVASFSSHVHRVQQVLDVAYHLHRKVAFVGRSMVKNMGVAQALGFLNVPEGLVVELKDIDNYGDDVVLICTGSQGEPLAALSRMANGDHKIQVGVGDTVILASSLIPGNESAVYRVINELVRFGAHVVHKGTALVHVSGHASAGELLYCYNIAKPKHVMPIHGEWRHLRANAELAIQSGVKRKNTIVMENGVVADMREGVVRIVGSVPVGFIYIDGPTIGEITESSLKDRRILGEEGFISVIVVIDAQSGKIIAGPDIHARGFTENADLFDEVKGKIEKSLAKAVANGINGKHPLSQVVRKTIGSWVGEEHRRKPMIVPVVIEV